MLIYVKPGGETVVSNESIGLGSRVARVDIVAPTRPGATTELLIMPASGKALPPYVCAPVNQLKSESVGVYSCLLNNSVTAVAGTVRYQIRFTYNDGTVEQTPAGSFVIQEGIIVVPPDDIPSDAYEEIKQILATVNANYADMQEKFDQFVEVNNKALETLKSETEKAKFIPRVVASLPVDGISATTIYLVRGGDSAGDQFKEYLFIPNDREELKPSYSNTEGAWEIIPSGLAAQTLYIPFFDLAALGLPAVKTNGTTSDLTTDTTPIRTALDNGSVKFAMNVEGYGRIEVVMNKYSIDKHGAYICSYYGFNIACTLMIFDGVMQVSVEPFVKLPIVSTDDEGKVLRVRSGEWIAEATAAAASAIPFYDLAALGLPTVATDGTTSDLTLDTTDICAALDKGAVKFALNVDGSGAVEVVMTKYEVNGLYLCTYTIFNLTLTLMIATNGIQASATAVSSAATYNGEVEVV